MGSEDAGSERETVTVTFITNHEIDPEEVDLRYKKPEKVLEQLQSAATCRFSIQEYASSIIPVTREKMDEERHRVKEARRSLRTESDA